MNVFTCGAEFGKLEVENSKNYYSFNSAATLSIYQIFSKIASTKLLAKKYSFHRLI